MVAESVSLLPVGADSINFSPSRASRALARGVAIGINLPQSREVGPNAALEFGEHQLFHVASTSRERPVKASSLLL